MLTPSEIDLLRQDLKSALSVVGQDEIDDARRLVCQQGFRGDDFEFVQQANSSPPYPAAVTGMVLVVRKDMQIEKAYRAGSGSSWLVEFEHDLKSRTFGGPQ